MTTTEPYLHVPILSERRLSDLIGPGRNRTYVIIPRKELGRLHNIKRIRVDLSWNRDGSPSSSSFTARPIIPVGDDELFLSYNFPATEILENRLYRDRTDERGAGQGSNFSNDVFSLHGDNDPNSDTGGWTSGFSAAFADDEFGIGSFILNFTEIVTIPSDLENVALFMSFEIQYPAEGKDIRDEGTEDEVIFDSLFVSRVLATRIGNFTGVQPVSFSFILGDLNLPITPGNEVVSTDGSIQQSETRRLEQLDFLTGISMSVEEWWV